MRPPQTPLDNVSGLRSGEGDTQEQRPPFYASRVHLLSHWSPQPEPDVQNSLPSSRPAAVSLNAHLDHENESIDTSESLSL